jgi:hypothetical protein
MNILHLLSNVLLFILTARSKALLEEGDQPKKPSVCKYNTPASAKKRIVITQPIPYYLSYCACKYYGLRLAAVTSLNAPLVSSALVTCHSSAATFGSARSDLRGWITSWNGDKYQQLRSSASPSSNGTAGPLAAFRNCKRFVRFLQTNEWTLLGYSPPEWSDDERRNTCLALQVSLQQVGQVTVHPEADCSLKMAAICM